MRAFLGLGVGLMFVAAAGANSISDIYGTGFANSNAESIGTHYLPSDSSGYVASNTFQDSHWSYTINYTGGSPAPLSEEQALIDVANPSGPYGNPLPSV